MIRRTCAVLFWIIVLSCHPLASGSHVLADTGGACSAPYNSYHSATGATTVAICPLVVESGHSLRFDIHAKRNQVAQVQLTYPNGKADRATGVTDDQGMVTLVVVVHYNPLYRYGQAQFQVTIGSPGSAAVDTVAGQVRVAQSATGGSPRLRVHPAGSGWCPDEGRCTVRNNTSLILRVESDPGAQVQVTLTYLNGESVSCPANSLNNGSFADDSGAYVCRLFVYFDLRKTKGSISMALQATVVSGSYPVQLQRTVWLKGS